MANPKTAKKHALQRLKSRQGIKDHSSIDDLVEEVLKYGVKVKDYPEGEIKEMLFRKYNSNTQRKRTYIYNNNVYIFSNDKMLITTYPLVFRRKDYVK